MNPMRIIGAANPNIKSVNRITYVIDKEEVVAYVNKSTLLGRYPNMYYAYEAVRGALMRCGCKDTDELLQKPIDVVSKYTHIPTVGVAFSANLNLDAEGPASFGYGTVQTRFNGTVDVPIVLTPIFTINDPRLSFMYKLAAGSISAPTSPAAALSAGFIPINSGDSILVPTGNASSNQWFLRIAPYWNVNEVFTVSPFLLRLFATTRFTSHLTSTTVTVL
jgi:hypothetical protein